MDELMDELEQLRMENAELKSRVEQLSGALDNWGKYSDSLQDVISDIQTRISESYKLRVQND
jgi:predicted nuclease with TOPRIM domain